MSNFSTAVTTANEIVKAVDFSYSHDQAINNIALGIQAIMTDGGKDFIIGGKVKPYASGGMNVVIEPIYGHCASSGVDFAETLSSQQPISIEDADPALDRIDIIQVRGQEEPYDYQDRKFRNPTTGEETTQNIATKKRIILNVSVKKGEAGSVTAKPADVGFVKLAEITVPAATVSINDDNIKNITARSVGVENGNWTMDKARTFNPGYLTDLVTVLLHDHKEDGSHKNESIKAANILFGNEAGAVKGTVIPTGESMNVRGIDYSALSGITQVMATLALAVNLAYPYANNVLGRFMLLDDTPVATSTANVDITAGGELSIDGILCTVGQMVFLKDQTDPKQNGLYEVQTGAWNRYTGYTSANPNAFTGKFILAEGGTANAGKMYYLDGDNYVIDTTPLDFRESMFSPQDLPGKAIIRGPDGKSNEDKKREDGLFNLRMDLTANADMVEGYGRDLLTVLGVSSIPAAMAELRRRCNNNGEIDNTGIPDFRGLMVGDYLDGLDLSGIGAPTGGTAPQAWNGTYKNNRLVISGFNTYKGVGDTENVKNHVLFTFRNVIVKGRMNSSDTNANGYPACELRAWLEGAAGDGSGSFAAGLKAAMGGNFLYTIRKTHSIKGGNAWNSFTVWLPTEIEVFGYQTYGDETAQYNTNVQFPIFQKSAVYRIKRFNGSRNWWWEQMPSASTSTNFCVVATLGYAGNGIASSMDGGVAPAFCVA
jgi:hypothetical protein